MGKRKHGGQGGNGKRFKSSSRIVEPGMFGIYATCPRRKEKQCANELEKLFKKKAEEYYDLSKPTDENDDEDDQKDVDNLNIEDQINKELAEIKSADVKDPKKDLISVIGLECECVLFIRTRRPIEPAEFVQKICRDSLNSLDWPTKFTQRLTPVSGTCSARLEEVQKLAKKILAPHFHGENQKPVKFAIRPQLRHHSIFTRDDIIEAVVACVGREHGHKVDLKQYDKLILVECFKSNVGISVVDNFDSLERFNMEKIREKAFENLNGAEDYEQNSSIKISKNPTREEGNVENSKEETKEESKEEFKN